MGSIKEIGEIGDVDPSYVSRMINLTTLEPWVIEAILGDKMPDAVTLFELAVDPDPLWVE